MWFQQLWLHIKLAHSEWNKCVTETPVDTHIEHGIQNYNLIICTLYGVCNRMCILTNGCSCESVEVLETVSWGGLELPSFGYMPNLLFFLQLELSGPDMCCPMFLKYWLWWYGYICSKFYIWNVNWSRAATFIFDSGTDVLLGHDVITFYEVFIHNNCQNNLKHMHIDWDRRQI